MKLAHGKMSQAVGKDSPTPAIQGATERIPRESAEVKSEPVHLAGLGEVWLHFCDEEALKGLNKGLCSKTPASKELGKEGKVLTGRSLGRL